VATRRSGNWIDDRPEPRSPLDAGDVATDATTRGFEGYRWLLEHLEPTCAPRSHTLAATREWKVKVGPTTVVNVSGAVVIDLLPPGRAPRRPARAPQTETCPRKTEPDR